MNHIDYGSNIDTFQGYPSQILNLHKHIVHVLVPQLLSMANLPSLVRSRTANARYVMMAIAKTLTL